MTDQSDSRVPASRPDGVAIDLLRRVATNAHEVMALLDQRGPSIVPHLVDTDENAGQRLRDSIEDAIRFLNAALPVPASREGEGWVQCPRCDGYHFIECPVLRLASAPETPEPRIGHDQRCTAPGEHVGPCLVAPHPAETPETPLDVERAR